MKKKSILVVLAVLLIAAAAGVLIWRNHVKQERLAVTEYSAVLDAQELDSLEQYPNLSLADLSGSDCYDEMDAWADTHPDVELRYTLPLGVGECFNNERTLELRENEYELDALLTALPHLRALESLTLPETERSAEELEALAQAAPQARLHWSRTILGKECRDDTESLDLSDVAPDVLMGELPQLQLLPALKRVELASSDGSSLYSTEEALAVRQALPEAEVHTVFTLFDKTVDSDDESLCYENVPIGAEGLEQIRTALALMPKCTYLKLADCGIDNETMAALRDEYADRVKVVWQVYLDHYGFPTDVEVIHLAFESEKKPIRDDNSAILNYCTDLIYLDLGHNTLTNIEFCRYMPKLKNIILSYNSVADMSPLGECPELEFAELKCTQVSDLSPFTACTKLRFLNVTATNVHDVTPVQEMKNLERFYCVWNSVPQEQKDALAEALPDCWITYEMDDGFNVGWSYDERGVRSEWYREIYRIYRYRVLDWYFGPIEDPA